MTTKTKMTREEKARMKGEAALAEFVDKKAEIDTMLARLQTLSDDHFGTTPDEANWGHVGTLDEIAAHLKRATDFAFNEGEYA